MVAYELRFRHAQAAFVAQPHQHEVLAMFLSRRSEGVGTAGPPGFWVAEHARYSTLSARFLGHPGPRCAPKRIAEAGRGGFKAQGP